MPELSILGDELYGIDPHLKNREVEEVLAAHGIQAELHSGSAEDLPFPDGFFDLIVSVSAIEYVPDLEKCTMELKRVLTPSGRAVVCTPGFSPLIDLGLRIATGQNPGQYGDRRSRLLPTLKREFDVEAELRFPRLPGTLLTAYVCVRLKPA